MRTMFVALVAAVPAFAYIEAPMSLGDVVNQSNCIAILRVKSVEKSKNLIVYDKVEDIKGKFPTATARHVIIGQLKEGEVKTVLDWAEPGKTAIFFAKDGACETCIDMYWYQVYKNGEDLYGMSHGEPFLLRSYAGKADRLPPVVRGILDGREVLTPAMEDNKELLHKRTGKIMRMKASLKILTYDPKRDFAGWGGEDIRRIAGGTGFSHVGPLSRLDAEARHASAIDFDGDGKLDACIAATGGVRLFQNQGEAYSEVSLPGLKGGARTAAWSDFNGDGKPDLLLATIDGPKLFTNLGATQFRDDSALLPRTPGSSAAAWLDADGDGKPDVLVATPFNGLRLYRNVPTKPFEDVSSKWNMTADGRGDTIAVADVNGDGRADFLHAGRLFANGGTKFDLKADAGLAFDCRQCGPTFLDFDGDGHVDLFVPQPGSPKLYKNDGSGKFADVIAQCGDLAKPIAGASSAAWGDFNNDGHIDVMVGVLRGPNRYLENKGDGTFADKTVEVGLTGKVYNSQAVALADLNGDGKLDLVMANEGQEAAILFGNKEAMGKATAVTVHLPGESLGGTVSVTGGSVKQSRAVSTGDGRGQPNLSPRFTLPPGTYTVSVKSNGGQAVTREVIVAAEPVKVRFDEKVAEKK